MPDVEKILKLVAEGALTPEEADEILSALGGGADREAADQSPAESSPGPQTAPRHLRVEVIEGGRRVVNLRVPVNVAGWASGYLPGLSELDRDRIRGAIASGARGTILDIGDDEGGRVQIVTE
jgi:hypothetical protein